MVGAGWPASAPLVPDAQLPVIDQPLPRQDIPLKVDGSAKSGLDTRLPGMLFAVVKHCPTFGGTLYTVEASTSSPDAALDRAEPRPR